MKRGVKQVKWYVLSIAAMMAVGLSLLETAKHIQYESGRQAIADAVERMNNVADIENKAQLISACESGMKRNTRCYYRDYPYLYRGHRGRSIYVEIDYLERDAFDEVRVVYSGTFVVQRQAHLHEVKRSS